MSCLDDEMYGNLLSPKMGLVSEGIQLGHGGER